MSVRRVPVLAFELAAHAGSVPRARHWVLAFAQEHTVDRELQGRIALAFDEAFTNAVRHAYDGPDPREDDICVSADVENRSLEIVVVDHGDGFQPHHGVAGLGAGLGIIAQSADAFAIRERIPGGTEVWMRFELEDGERPAP